MPPHHEPSTDEIAAMDFFKTCVVSKDYDAIVDKLKNTADYRKNQLRNSDKFENIPDFYFADPTLVNV